MLSSLFAFDRGVLGRHSMSITKIGFIGLGAMGMPMACNLLNAGYQVRVYNRTRSKSEALAERGAEIAVSPGEASQNVQMVITILPDSPVVKEVLAGPQRVLALAKPGVLIADMSTISPAAAMEIGSDCQARGLRFLDAPVSGGESGAIGGTLSIMVGGDADTLAEARPVFEALGSRITHMGPVGSGQIAKLCNQVVCGLNILATCEGLALGLRSGIDPARLLEAITPGAAGSWMLSNLGPKMISKDWSPGFKISLQQKDLRIALEWAAQNLLPLMGTAEVHQLFRCAEASGSSDEGTQALFKIIRGLGKRAEEAT